MCRAALFFLAASLFSASPARAELDAATVAGFREAFDRASIDPGDARIVGRTKIQAGPATVELRGGWVYPVRIPGSASAATYVFVGRGRIDLSPRDAVERQQLELFTGSETLSETFGEALLLVANDDAGRALVRADAPPMGDPAALAKATERLEAWKKGTLRKALATDAALLTDEIEGGSYDGYFLAVPEGDSLGEFWYVVDPDAAEEVSLGQFVPEEMSSVERQGARESIGREQRRGRSRDLDLNDLGDLDTWVSTTLDREDGKRLAGGPAFEATRYVLDVGVVKSPLTVDLDARVTLRAVDGERRVVPMTVSRDMDVVGVTDAATHVPLPFYRAGGDLRIVLASPPRPGEDVEVVVRTSGRILQEGRGGTYALRNTVGWYPRIDSEGRATYDATFHFPKGMDLLAAGVETGSGEDERGPWKRYRMDIPVLAYTFEYGKFRIEKVAAGHIEVTFAFDPVTNVEKQMSREEIEKTVADALAFFEERYGPYPMDNLTVVTVRRGFSQGLLSFLTLSGLAITTEDWQRRAFQIGDFRPVIAHEVSHQWWGNLVGWSGYRDQWLSEALANYSATRFARSHLDWKDALRIGPTARWREYLLEISQRGIPVDALGPVVLGTRLSSSLEYGTERGAYFPIVYLKGALVFDTLSRYFKDDAAFDTALRAVVERAGGGVVSTEAFLATMERASGASLGAFADRFIYGTGIPEIYYRYETKPAPDGGWEIRGAVRHHLPFRWDYSVVELPGGGFDVRRTRREQMNLEGFAIVVPTQVGMASAEGPQPKRGAKTKLERCNVIERGRLLLTNASGDFTIAARSEPKAFFFDLDKETYALYYEEDDYPKRVAYYSAIDAASRGEETEAEAHFRRVLGTAGEIAADVPKPPEAVEAERFESRLLDLESTLGLARIAMDRGDLDAATSWMDRAKTVDPWLRRYAGRDLLVTRARLDILTGRADDARRDLAKRLFATLKPDRLYDPEAFALLAIAATRLNDADLGSRALRLARRYGVDVSAASGLAAASR